MQKNSIKLYLYEYSAVIHFINKLIHIILSIKFIILYKFNKLNTFLS